MGLRGKEKYDPGKIDKLIDYLRIYREKGDPIDYEIIVDGFKAVRRTNDIDMFPMFENFIGVNTKSMDVLLYTGTSNNNDKYIFTFEDDVKEPLSGIEVDSRINEQLALKQKEWEKQQLCENLEKANKDLKQEVAELEKEVEELEKQKAALEANKSPFQNFLGEFGSSFLESLLRRNPKLLAGLPGGEALAGIIDEDNKRREQQESQTPQSETEVSFKPRTEAQAINEDDKAAIVFVNQLKSQFTKEEFDKILLILQTLADDKSKIELIINHVNIKNKML